MKTSTQHGKHRLAAENSFTEWLKKFDEFPYYPKFFGLPQKTVDAAVKRLLEIDFILHTKNLAGGLNTMLERIGVKQRFDNTKINAFPKPNPTEQDKQLIRRLRKADYEVLAQIEDKHPNYL